MDTEDAMLGMRGAQMTAKLDSETSGHKSREREAGVRYSTRGRRDHRASFESQCFPQKFWERVFLALSKKISNLLSFPLA